MNQLENTINFLLNNLRITRIKLLRLILHGRAKENRNILIHDEKEIYRSILRLKEKFIDSKVEIGTAFSILSNSCIECQAAISKFMITTDLKLFPCTAFKNRTKCYIQINNKNSLKKIISFRLIRRRLQNFNEKLECNYCLDRNNCIEICPLQKMICEKPIKSDIIEHVIQEKVLF